MAKSSITGGETAPLQHSGTDVDALGPSDTSDSGSDVRTGGGGPALVDEEGEVALPTSPDGTSDSGGTGERASVDMAAPRSGADLLPDRVGALPGDELAADARAVDRLMQEEDGDENSEDSEDDSL